MPRVENDDTGKEDDEEDDEEGEEFIGSILAAY